MNITVDDILDEIKQGKNQGAVKPLASMDHVDELIKEILEKRQSDELRRQGRTVSLKEKMELEEEIKEKTKTLTVEFEKMRQNHDRRLEEVVYEKPESKSVHHSDILEQEYAKSHAIPPVHMSPTQELSILRLQKNQHVKFRDTAELEVSQEIKAHREQKYDNLKRAANNERLLSEMKNITDHFGNFKMEDKSVEDGYQKLAINPASYKELKSNRSRVIDAFVLDPKKPPQKETSLAEKAAPQNQIADEVLSAAASTEVKNEFSISEDVMNSVREKRDTVRENASFSRNDAYESPIAEDIEYDYNHKAQRDEILASLNKTLLKTNTSMIVLAVLSVLSLGLIFSRPSDEKILMAASIPVSPMIYAFVILGLLLASIIAAFSIFANAFHSIAEKKPDKDILYSVALIVSFLSASFLSISPQKLLTDGVCYYVPVMVILLFVNFFSKRLTVKQMITSFEKISGDEELYAVTPVTDQKAVEGMMSGVNTMGSTMLLRNVKTGFVRRFLVHACVADKSDYLSNKLAVASVIVTIFLFAIAYFVSRDFYLAVSIAGAVPLCFIGVLLPLLVSMPLKDASGVARHFTGAMPDYDAIDTYNETDGIMLEATDLFPENSVLLHGIKTFKGKRIDDAILDAASVVCAAKSVLEPVFLSIIASQTKLLKPVDSIVYEDSMGISGWVSEKRVLIGNRELMINHSIAVPKEEYENKYKEQNHELVYLSCEGELSAAFVIEFTASSKATDMVDLLQKNEVAMLIRSVDSGITQELIERVFDIAPDTFKILPSHMHRAFAEQHEPLKNTDGAMPNNGGAFSMVVLIAICKRMTSCIKLGVVMQIVSVVGALLLLTASTILKLPGIAGPLQLILFMAFFFVVYWIYEKNVKL